MRTITSTYRLQLHGGFGFQAARAVVDYLDALGVSHAYASPYLEAEPGSQHGYDLVDPRRLNPELGSERDYLDWTETLASREMGHILDFVPNHMAASTHNAWWFDVLENGPSSLYANHFDIDWDPQKEALTGKVLLAVLGAQYGEVLERGELRLERNAGAFFIRYGDRLLPVNPRSVTALIERAAARLEVQADDPGRSDLESIVTGLKNLPLRTETDPERQKERAREKEVLKRRLGTLAESETLARVLDEEVSLANGTPGDARSFDELDRILMDQSYRLAFWRVATEEINYRRFFDVNELAAVRMEDSAVFDDAHELLLRLVAEGRVQGVRLDHTDGLYDPAAYFATLRRAIESSCDRLSSRRREIYLLAEKILAFGEELPQAWAIEGTTGYDFLVQASGVFIERSAERPFTRLWHELTSDTRPFGEHVRDAKRAIMRSSLSSEIHMLSRRLERIAMRDRRSRDFTLPMLHRAVIEMISAFSVYRTYVRPDGSRGETDEQMIRRATRVAQRHNPEVVRSVFELLRDVLLLAHEPLDDDRERLHFAMRFQQLTGPVMAKSVEDTAFYTYGRFVALNEVGGAPERFGTSIGELHAGNTRRRAKWPRTMISTSTHDTKRGEDVRARLAVLTEIPATWEAWVREWLAIASGQTTTIDEETAPSVADQYLFFQTALGAYPLLGGTDDFITRLVEYAIKAAREAKQRTSWLAPDEPYEEALKSFVTGMFSLEAFETALETAADAIATYGVSNSLAQVVLKIASPGVVDTYQGSELWDYRLVDPDNRRPVDFEARRAALRSLEGARPRDLLASFRDGRVKLHVLRAGLRLRRTMPQTFLEGSYTPIDAGDDIVAFARNHDAGSVVCAVTRRPHHVTGGRAPFAIGDAWAERRVAVPRGAWRDALTGEARVVERNGIDAAKLFAHLPVALLFSR